MAPSGSVPFRTYLVDRLFMPRIVKGSVHDVCPTPALPVQRLSAIGTKVLWESVGELDERVSGTDISDL
jgi:hypothetical protein